MRQPASVLCATLILGGAATGCAAARRPAAPAPGLATPEPRYAAVSPGAPAASGGRANTTTTSGGGPSHGSAAFGNFVRAREPQLQFCYHEARATTPDLVGSATVAVTLDDGGSVLGANIIRRSWSAPKAADVVETCLLDKVRSWHFPAVDPRDEHVHSFAVIFSS